MHVTSGREENGSKRLVLSLSLSLSLSISLPPSPSLPLRVLE